MAGASMKAIKNRIKSVESTMQITKAMELVATSKLRKAKEAAENTRPFFRILQETIADIIGNSRQVSSPFLEEYTDGDTCWVVIAGDRGLAGGYNHNLFRLTDDALQPADSVLPIGKKSVEHYTRAAEKVITTAYDLAADVDVTDADEIARLLCSEFRKGSIRRVMLVYTKFVNMLSQVPQVEQLLPLNPGDFALDLPGTPRSLTIYEPSEEQVLDAVIPQVVSGMLYSAACEACAAEQAARRTAMNSANKNAGEMIDSLKLNYNRARQAVITQEITEIVAGSEAL